MLRHARSHTLRHALSNPAMGHGVHLHHRYVPLLLYLHALPLHHDRALHEHWLRLLLLGLGLGNSGRGI
jgi:hypothetical protein